MAIGITLRLYDGASALANLTGITALWWDETVPLNFESPIGKTEGATTDGSGDLILDLSGVSSLSSGQDGFLLLRKLDAGDHKDSPVFSGKVTTSSVSSGVKLEPNFGWTRPASWPALSDVSGGQKVSVLHAVFPRGPNWCAFTFTTSSSAQYTVEWGDGTSNSSVNSGTAAEHSYSYTNCSDNDIGKDDAIACTFTDSTDTVNATGHPFLDGGMVEFSSITSTTGISVGVIYYVVNRAADSFQVADAPGGSAKTLTTDGSGSMYAPIYRFAVMNIYPTTGGGSLVTANWNVRHSGASAGSAVDYAAGWLDVSVHAANMTSCVFGGSPANNIPAFLERFVAHALGTFTTAYYYMFSRCRNLKVISLPSTAAGTNFSYMMYGCSSLRVFPLIDTSSCTNFSSMMNGCSSLIALPLIDTSLGTDFSYMMYNCSALSTFPPIDTSSGTNFSYMMSGCSALKEFPLINTAAGTNFSNMLYGCSLLKTFPLIDTSSGTDFSSMVYSCGSLEVMPPLNVSNATTLSTMFAGCYSLQVGVLQGTAQNIVYPAGQLSGTELNAIYTALATVTGKTITVTGNYGTASDDPSIATAKGWTVTS